MTNGIAGISGYNYNDPYLAALMQSYYNPSFQAAGTSAQTTAAAAPTTQTASAPVVTTPAVATPAESASEKKEDSSNTALWVGGALAIAAAAGCIYAYKRGDGKGIVEGFKNIWQDIKGASSKLISGMEGKTTKFTVVKNANGEMQFLVPDKQQVIKGEKAIREFAGQNGINLEQLIGLKDGKSIVTGGKFNIDGYTVNFENGKITDIFDSAYKKVTSEFLGVKPNELSADSKATLTKFTEFIEKAGKDPVKFGKDGLTMAEVTRQIGDDTLKVMYACGEKPSIVSLTTLERLGKDSDAVKNELFKNPKLKEILESKEFAEQGKILAGRTPESVRFTFDGRDFVFKNGKLEGFYETVNGKSLFRKQGSEKCGAYLCDNGTKLSDYYKDLFKDGTVPDGVSVRFAL